MTRTCLSPPIKSKIGETFLVAGVQYRAEAVRDAYERYLEGDERLLIKPEPTNEYDPHALKVIIARKHVGYVPRVQQDIYAPGVEFVIRRFTLDSLGNAKIVIERVS